MKKDVLVLLLYALGFLFLFPFLCFVFAKWMDFLLDRLT